MLDELPDDAGVDDELPEDVADDAPAELVPVDEAEPDVVPPLDPGAELELPEPVLPVGLVCPRDGVGNEVMADNDMANS